MAQLQQGDDGRLILQPAEFLSIRLGEIGNQPRQYRRRRRDDDGVDGDHSGIEDDVPAAVSRSQLGWTITGDQLGSRGAGGACQRVDQDVEAALKVAESLAFEWRAPGRRPQPDLAPEPDHGDLIVIAPELRPELRAKGAVVGAGPERSAQPCRGGDRFKPLPVAHALQVGGDQSDAEAIVDRQKSQA